MITKVFKKWRLGEKEEFGRRLVEKKLGTSLKNKLDNFK